MIVQSDLIASPLERVFELIADFDRMRSWMTNLEETVLLGATDAGESRIGVGTRFRQRLREGGHTVEYEGEIVSFAAPHRLGLRMISRQADVHLEFRCRQVQPGVARVEVQADLKPKTLTARLAIPLYQGRARERVVAHLGRLKDLAESG